MILSGCTFPKIIVTAVKAPPPSHPICRRHIHDKPWKVNCLLLVYGNCVRELRDFHYICIILMSVILCLNVLSRTPRQLPIHIVHIKTFMCSSYINRADVCWLRYRTDVRRIRSSVQSRVFPLVQVEVREEALLKVDSLTAWMNLHAQFNCMCHFRGRFQIAQRKLTLVNVPTFKQ